MAKASVHTTIVNYNAGDWLLRSVNSALSNTDGAVTVVDNASSDNSIQKLKAATSDARLNIIQNDANLGFSAANNQAIKSRQADYVILMNPDCEMQAGAWDAIRDVMQANPEIGLAGGRIQNEDGSLQSTAKRDFPTPGKSLLRLLGLSKIAGAAFGIKDFDHGAAPASGNLEWVDAISGAFMVVRSDAIEKVGLLDEGYFMHCEDLDWCKRFWQTGYKVAWVPASKITHAKGISSTGRPVRVLWHLHAGMDRFFCKHEASQYNLFYRYFIRLGIYVLFLPRAVKAMQFRGSR